MSRVEGALELAIGPDEVEQCWRQAIAELGWTVVGQQPGVLEAREDITRLACCQSPAETKLETATSRRGCALRLATKVPGFGPVSSSHVKGRHSALVRTFHKHLTAAQVRGR